MKIAYQGSGREWARALTFDAAYCPDSDSRAAPVDAAENRRGAMKRC